jgi:hypothetical protein
LDSCGFLTLTVGDYQCNEHGKQLPKGKCGFCPICHRKMVFKQIFDANEASRRFNSLYSNFLADQFLRAVVVSERCANGAIHFHLLGVLVGLPDIRRGYNFGRVRAGDYASVSPELRAIWRVFRSTLPAYGFGRASLEPIRKTGSAVASYVSKYVEKNVTHRCAADRRKKLVRYHGFRRHQLKPNEFEWNTPAARAWRSRAASALGLVGVDLPDLNYVPLAHVSDAVASSGGQIRQRCLDGSQACFVIGPRWAFYISMLLDRLDLGHGDVLAMDYSTGQLLSGELQRLAGRSWCEENDKEVCRVLLGETYSRAEWDEMMEFFRKGQN